MVGHHDRPFRPWTGYGLVLALILVSFIWSAVSESQVDQAGRVVMGAAIFLLALRAASIRPRVIALAALPVAVLVVVALIAIANDDPVAIGIALLINASLILGITAAVYVDIRRTPEITIHLIGGLLCVYLVLGLAFSLVYKALDQFAGDPFFAETSTPNSIDFLYYSFTTLTTVGYGDLTAAQDLGRTLSVIEALTGQLYLVTVVSLAVANFGRARRRVDSS